MFTICRPRASEQPAKAQQPSWSEPVSPSVRFETVLVCDDDVGVRQLVADVLRLRGYTVLQAHSGKHALEVCAEHRSPVDSLVKDLVMPDSGGMELAMQMRWTAARLSVLFTSGIPNRHACFPLLSDLTPIPVKTVLAERSHAGGLFDPRAVPRPVPRIRRGLPEGAVYEYES